MADETYRTKDPGEAKSPVAEKKPYVDPISRLTPEQLQRAWRKGIEDSSAQSASVRRDLLVYYWKRRMPEAREEVSKAESALQAYLERPSSEPTDVPRHRQLAEDLKRATDDLKHWTDEYVSTTLVHYPIE
jgi:hypothetical protein